MDVLNLALVLLGRALLCAIFLISGVGKIRNPSGDGGQMRQKGIPAAGLLLIVAAIVEVLGGFSILLGFYARFGALVLFLYLIPVTFLFHNYWAFPDKERMAQMENFLKNLTIMGGLLLVAGLGSGPLSLTR